MSRGISYLKKSVISRGILGGWSTILWGSPAKFQRDETAGKLICSLTKSFDTPEIAVNCPVRSESFESCRSLSNRCFRWSHRRRVNTLQFRVLSTIRSDLTIIVDTDLARRKHGLSKAIILIAFQISRSIRKFSSIIFSGSWGVVSSQNVITHRNARKSSWVIMWIKYAFQLCWQVYKPLWEYRLSMTLRFFVHYWRTRFERMSVFKDFVIFYGFIVEPLRAYCLPRISGFFAIFAQVSIWKDKIIK